MKRRVAISLIGAAFVLVLVVVAALEWGSDNNSRFVVGKPLPPGKVTPQLVIDYAERAVLLAPDGTIWFWGGDLSRPGMSFTAGSGARTSAPNVSAIPQRISDDTDWRQVALASASLVALKSDGSLWGWNAVINGGPAGSNFSAGKPSPPQRIGTDSDWVQISARVSHFMALKADGSLWGWGQNESGQIGNGISNRIKVSVPVMVGSDHDWKAIAAGAFNSYALKRDGTLWGWGSAINPGQNNRVNIYSPEQIDPGTNWTAISVGDYHLIALKSDGTIWLRGQNAHITASSAYPSTPAGTPKDRSTLLRVGEDSDWDRVCSGDNCFFARKRNGSWWACGSDSGGQLGVGSLNIAITVVRRGGGMPGDVASPQRLPFDFEPWAFGSGGPTTLLLTRDGNLWSWGTRLGVNKSKGIKEWYDDGVTWMQKTLHFKSQTAAQSRMVMRGSGSFGSGGFGSGGFGSSVVRRPMTDHGPYRIWKLPADIRTTLETNADKPAEAQATKQP